MISSVKSKHICQCGDNVLSHRPPKGQRKDDMEYLMMAEEDKWYNQGPDYPMVECCVCECPEYRRNNG